MLDPDAEMSTDKPTAAPNSKRIRPSRRPIDNELSKRLQVSEKMCIQTCVFPEQLTCIQDALVFEAQKEALLERNRQTNLIR